MACHLAGFHKLLGGLRSLENAQFAVESVSCLGRCDRAPAVCVSKAGHHSELYYHGRSLEEMKGILMAVMQAVPPRADCDTDHAPRPGNSRVDPYNGKISPYLAVRKVIAAREASLDAATEVLRASKGWGHERLEQFRARARRPSRLETPLPREVAAAARDWQTEDAWAKGPQIGGWADAFFQGFDEAGLRGLGGAGIPVSQKWRDVRDAVRDLRRREMGDERAFIVANGDESEPGTFKDREILLRHPHTVVEGIILAGLLTEATQGFIYIRHEYPEQIAACRAEVRRAKELGFCGEEASELGRPFPISIFVSPGGYICGEQSALVEAMSDRRAEPRNMPPKLETNGLLNLPTLVSNVETFAWTPFICLEGGRVYADEGANGWKGRRFFSVSGDVRRPGVYEVPVGITLREIVESQDYCQGIAGNRPLKAFAPSGPSGGFLPAKLTAANGLPREHTKNKTWLALAARRGFDPNAAELDILDLELELDLFRALTPTAALGAGLVVYDDTRDMVDEAVKSLEFFRNESCGKCVPCRIGSQKLASLGVHLAAGQITAARWEAELVPLIKELGNVIGLTSICGLGRSAPLPLITVLQFFTGDVSSHLTGPKREPSNP